MAAHHLISGLISGGTSSIYGQPSAFYPTITGGAGLWPVLCEHFCVALPTTHLTPACETIGVMLHSLPYVLGVANA